MDKLIYPAKRICGEAVIPGDKSISHRALMIAAIAEGVTKIENLSDGDDVTRTAQCLRNLGVEIETHGNLTSVRGEGLLGLSESDQILDVGNSGTTARILSGILSAQKFTSRLTGDDSIRRRPMSRIFQPLRLMGATIHAVDDEYMPFAIHGGNLKAIDYKMPVASAQVKSCLLLAGLYSNGKTILQEPSPTRDHTEKMLGTFGAKIEKKNGSICLTGPSELQAQNLFIPGDLSSAAFLIAAAILVKESNLCIKNVGVNPTRTAFLNVLSEMGANLKITNVSNVNNETVADIIVKSSRLKGVKISGPIIPQLIDEIPILAVLATQAVGETEIRNAEELKYKESNRIVTIVDNLKKMGADIVATDDGMVIDGPVPLKNTEVDSCGDHRIAMALAVAALMASKPSTIQNWECVNTSFPGFLTLLDTVAVFE